MHFNWLVSFVFVILFRGLIGKEKCGMVSRFEALCIKFETVFILATHPCTEMDYVNLVIARPGSTKQDSFFFSHGYHRKDNNIKAVNIGSDRSVIIDLHMEDVVANKLHVTLSVNSTEESNSSKFTFILDVFFDINTENCIGFFPPHLGPESWINDTYCHNHNKKVINRKATICHRGGDTTTIIILDVCSAPYKLHVYVYGNGLDFHHIFTQAEKKVYPLKVSGLLGGACGLMLEKFHSTGHPFQMQHAKLIHHCRSTNTNVTLIDHSYYTTYGTMCGYDNCTKESLTEHKCNLMDSSIPYNLKRKCNGDYSLGIETKDGINFTGLVLKKGHVKGGAKLSQNITKKMFGLDSESFINYTVLKKAGAFQLLSDLVVVVNTNDLSFTWFRDEFHYLAHTDCPSDHSKHVYIAMKVIIPIVCLLTIAAIVYVLYKRHQKRKSVPYNQSLPYQIDLGDDDFPMES